MTLPLVKKSYPIWGQRCKKNPHWLHSIWKFSFSDDQSHVSSFQWWPKWWLEKRYRPILEDILLHAFEVLDPAKHGFLSKEELIKQRTKEGESFEFNSLQGLSNNNSDKINMLEKTLESPLDCKVIKPVTLKGNQSWIFTGRTDAEALIL